MRRGRIFLYLALIVIVGVIAVVLYLWVRRAPPGPTPSATPTTSQISYVEIVTAGQNIFPGAPITEDMLSTLKYPQDQLVEGMITNKQDLVGKYAKIQIAQNIIITESMVSDIPGIVNLPGSSWAPFIPQGLTAVAVPMTRLSSVGFGIRDGDYVNIIVTILLVDVDPALQTVLPNRIAGLELTEGTLKISDSDVLQGHFELDKDANFWLYVLPAEKQRPRLVSQMIMQNIQVLHVGSFPLPGEAGSEQLFAQGAGAGGTPTPVPTLQQQTVTITRPDIITLMVTPQDAVTLTYLIYNGAEITLTLRNPNDQKPAPQPEAANLEYLLTQYNIPIPAKLPYSLEPRIDQLQQPKLPNDATPIPQR